MMMVLLCTAPLPLPVSAHLTGDAPLPQPGLGCLLLSSAQVGFLLGQLWLSLPRLGWVVGLLAFPPLLPPSISYS